MTAAPAASPALSADLRAARLAARASHPAGSGTRRSRALPRRSAPVPLAVDEGVALARRPWRLEATGLGLSRAVLDDDAPVDMLKGLAVRSAEASPATLLVRGAVAADLPALAAFHGRCTGTTLLQRYRNGGRAPSLTAMVDLLREPLVLVVTAGPQHVVALATASVGERPSVDFTTDMGVLVEDAWQARGVGSALARHVGAALRHLGYGQVVTRSATSSLPLSRVMDRVGTTRHGHAPGGGTQLLTRLDVSALDGLAGGGGTLPTASAPAPAAPSGRRSPLPRR